MTPDHQPTGTRFMGYMVVNAHNHWAPHPVLYGSLAKAEAERTMFTTSKGHEWIVVPIYAGKLEELA